MNVVVISEVRALSRKQVEIFVIYDLLQKYGVRLETVLEKFEDSVMGRLILSLRAAFSEIERDQIFMRLQRGKRSRLEEGAPNGHPKPAYGYKFYDTPREIKAGYELNHDIVHVDAEGHEWSEFSACQFILGMLKERISLNQIVYRLNDIGIPSPRKSIKGVPHWTASTLFRMFSNPIYMGEVWCNKFKKVNGSMVKRPKEEWILLDTPAPAMIDRETFDKIQEQFMINKQDALRNNKHSDTNGLGLLRSGYIYCGICHCKMTVTYPTPSMIKNHNLPFYRCQQREGTKHALNHATSLALSIIDDKAWEKILEILRNPELVRQRVQEMRKRPELPVNEEDVKHSLAEIQTEMDNLFELARHATSDATITRLGKLMEDLEKRYRETEALLIDFEESQEEQEEIEKAIVKFETWMSEVSELLLTDDYVPTYEEKRSAIRIVGIKVTVFPVKGDHPYRYKIEAMLPAIAKKIVLQSTPVSHL